MANIVEGTGTAIGAGAVSDRVITYEYDALGRLISASDPDSEYAYAFDNYDRLATVDNDGTPLVPRVILTHGYDEYSRKVSTRATIGGTADYETGFTYDFLSRLRSTHQVGQSGGNGVYDKGVVLGYDANNQLTEMLRQTNHTSWTDITSSGYTYDAMGRVTLITHTRSSTSGVVASHSYAYDAASRITSYQNATSVENATYTYDNTNQLVGADRILTDYDEAFDYDANGNRDSTGYSTGDNNQMLSDGVYDYEYDAEGNRTLKENISTGARTEYYWDFRNRLKRIVLKDGAGAITDIVDYVYDVNNLRIAKKFDMDADLVFEKYESYALDDDDIVLAFADADGEGTSSSAVLTNRYLHGAAVDQVLADEQISTPGSAGDTYWMLTDNLGSVRDIADDTGAVVEHIAYDSFGNIGLTTGSIDYRFGFTGREHDAETGMRYHRARYFDGSRWISEDPIGFEAGDGNLSRYLTNAPTIYVDPSGLILAAIDGTESRPFLADGNAPGIAPNGNRNSHTLNFREDYQEGEPQGPARHFHGPVQDGSDSLRIRDRVFDWLREEWLKGPRCKENSYPIDLVGHSRGGYIANEVAWRIHNEGFTDSEGNNYPVEVRFLGLLDPVSMDRTIPDQHNTFAPADAIYWAEAAPISTNDNNRSRWIFRRVDGGPSQAPAIYMHDSIAVTHSAIGGAPGQAADTEALFFREPITIATGAAPPNRTYVWMRDEIDGANQADWGLRITACNAGVKFVNGHRAGGWNDNPIVRWRGENQTGVQ